MRANLRKRSKEELRQDEMRIRKITKQVAQPDFKRDGLSLEDFTVRANKKLKELGVPFNFISIHRQEWWKEAWEEGVSTPEQAAVIDDKLYCNEYEEDRKKKSKK